MARVTITLRHTGRFCVSLDAADFAELYGMVLFAEGARIFSSADPAQAASRQRITKAFKQFSNDLKSKVQS